MFLFFLALVNIMLCIVLISSTIDVHMNKIEYNLHKPFGDRTQEYQASRTRRNFLNCIYNIFYNMSG